MANHQDHHEHHIIPFKTYATILGILLVMTVITVGASRIDFGALNAFIAMLIATVKATLVLMYFMHLKYDDKMYPAILITSVLFLLVMFGFSYLDIITRIPIQDIR
jgi:cytochrome c oxidase subunit IV